MAYYVFQLMFVDCGPVGVSVDQFCCFLFVHGPDHFFWCYVHDFFFHCARVFFALSSHLLGYVFSFRNRFLQEIGLEGFGAQDLPYVLVSCVEGAERVSVHK